MIGFDGGITAGSVPVQKVENLATEQLLELDEKQAQDQVYIDEDEGDLAKGNGNNDE